MSEMSRWIGSIDGEIVRGICGRSLAGTAGSNPARAWMSLVNVVCLSDEPILVQGSPIVCVSVISVQVAEFRLKVNTELHSAKGNKHDTFHDAHVIRMNAQNCRMAALLVAVDITMVYSCEGTITDLKTNAP